MRIYGDCCGTKKKPVALRLEALGQNVRVTAVDAETGKKLGSGNIFNIAPDGRCSVVAGFSVPEDYENPFTGTPRI